jgi:hypothetical protein
VLPMNPDVISRRRQFPAHRHRDRGVAAVPPVTQFDASHGQTLSLSPWWITRRRLHAPVPEDREHLAALYRLRVSLPCEVDVGQGRYRLDLVVSDRGDECWWRAWEQAEPTVFLLARFSSRETAVEQLYRGFQKPRGGFVQLLVRILLAQGLVEPVVRPRVRYARR